MSRRDCACVRTCDRPSNSRRSVSDANVLSVPSFIRRRVNLARAKPRDFVCTFEEAGVTSVPEPRLAPGGARPCDGRGLCRRR